MTNVVRLIPWGSVETDALIVQLQERIRESREKNELVGFCGVLVTQDAENRTYDCFVSKMPVEFTLWAADKLKRRIIEVVQEHQE